MRRVYRSLATTTLLMVAVFACVHAPEVPDGPHCGGTGEQLQPPPQPKDCRAYGCAQLGDMCVTDGCERPWRCEACTLAIAAAPRMFCGCDGKPFVTDNIGCRTHAVAYEGPCR